MLYKLVALLIISCISFPAFGRDKPAYTLYNADGKKVSYRKLYKKAKKSDIISFGELHNNPIAHWLQLELCKDLHAAKTLTVGAEMFEADNQQALDDYLSGVIDYAGLDSQATLWLNYVTDYAPIVEFARKNRLTFICTNIPSRFARKVQKNGDCAAIEKLSKEEKAWIVPLPIQFDPELPQYKKILSMTDGHGTPELVKAQAVRDATMAHFILLNYTPGSAFLHLNGAYHSDFHESIVFYLKQQNDSLQYLTVSTVEQSNIQQLEDEHRSRADFIICVDEDMTKTH